MITIITKYGIEECENQTQNFEQANEENNQNPLDSTNVIMANTTNSPKEINVTKIYNTETSSEVVYFAIGGIVLLVLVIGTIFAGNYLCKKYCKVTHLGTSKDEGEAHNNENFSFNYVHPHKSSQIYTSYPLK